MLTLTPILACVLTSGAGLATPTMTRDRPINTAYLERHTQTRGFMLGRPVKARPTPDGSAVLFLRTKAREPSYELFEFDVTRKSTRLLATPETILKGGDEKLSTEERSRRERQRISVGGFTDYQISPDGKSILVSLSGRLHLVDRGSGRSRELATGPGAPIDPRFSPDGRTVSYVRAHDLRAYDLGANRERSITTGGSKDRTNGLAEFIAQEEMGRFTGYWWSPDSKRLAFEEADSSAVETWWVADPARPDQEPVSQRYPRPGKENVKVRLGLVAASGGPVRWIEWERARYPYLASVRWDDEGPLTIVVQTREQDELALLHVDLESGRTRPLVVERDRAWVPLRAGVPRWLAKGESFVWSAESGEDRVLELRDRAGIVKSVVHRQKGGLLEVESLDVTARRVWFSASEDPRELHVHRLDLPEPGQVSLQKQAPGAVRVTEGAGIHKVTLAKNHALWTDGHVEGDAMPSVAVREPDGRTVAVLPSVAEEPPIRPRAELVEADGLHASIVRPRDFDRGFRYPVVVDVYGGPGHLKVTHSMGARLLPQWLADCGFIVVSIDNRGTPGRGRSFERAISGKLGDVPLEDQVKGLKALLASHPEMDPERVGIVGWSFGGYLSALALLRRPDVYRAAVAGAPVADWLDYDTHYTERYLGLPSKNRRDYERASLLTYAKELSRPLLIIHGTADDNVYFLHSLRLAQALFTAGRPFDLLPLPALTHMVPQPLIMQRMWGRIVSHFRDHLGSPEPARRTGRAVRAPAGRAPAK